MTFIDVSQGRPSSGLIAGYSILCVVSLICASWAVNLGRSRYHYRSFFSVRVLFPIALFILALENAALAASGRIYDSLLKEGGDKNYDSNLFMKAVFVLQTFEVPILLIVIFEITYLVHKRRSVNFCGMYFDEGVRVKNTAFMSCMLRNSIRTLATVLLIMGLIVNFNLIYSGAPVDELAGRAGWWALSGEDWEGKVHLLLSLIPTAVLTLVSFYLSIMLWRYGTESAMVVHSSICNPWFYSFFGTLAMAVGQLFGEKLYTVMSNAGVLIFIITILLLMAEVDKDIVATNDVACFLVQVAQKGDQIRVVTSLQMQLPRHDPPLRREEEKTPEDEEAGPGTMAESVTRRGANDANIVLDRSAIVPRVFRGRDIRVGDENGGDDKENASAQFTNQEDKNRSFEENGARESGNNVSTPPDQIAEIIISDAAERNGFCVLGGSEKKKNAIHAEAGMKSGLQSLIIQPDRLGQNTLSPTEESYKEFLRIINS